MGIYSIHAYLINQCQKAVVIQKQILSIDNNWRNTEICHRSGYVSHADARGSLRRVSWDKEFTPYALNLNIQFISPGVYKAKQSRLQRIQCIYQVWFPCEPLVLESGHVCHLRYLVFQGDLLVPFRACCHGAVVLETTQSGPQQGTTHRDIYDLTSPSHLFWEEGSSRLPKYMLRFSSFFWGLRLEGNMSHSYATHGCLEMRVEGNYEQGLKLVMLTSVSFPE